MQEKNEKTVISLNREELEIFMWCWKNYEIWKEAFELAPGSLVLHFDVNNDLKKYEIHRYKQG